MENSGPVSLSSFLLNLYLLVTSLDCAAERMSRSYRKDGKLSKLQQSVNTFSLKLGEKGS